MAGKYKSAVLWSAVNKILHKISCKMSRLILRTAFKYRWMCLNATKLPTRALHSTLNKYQLETLQTKTDWSRPASVENPKIKALYKKVAATQQALGYASYEPIEKLLKLLEFEKNLQLSSDESLLLLQACGLLLPNQTADKRWSLFERVWHILSEKQLLTKTHYQVRFEAMKYNQIAVQNVDEFIKEYPYELSLEFFTNLLQLTCSSKNLAQTEQVLLEIQNRGWAWQPSHYDMLLRAYGSQNELTIKVLEKLQGDAALDTLDTQLALLLNALETSQSEVALKMLQERQDSNLEDLLKILQVAMRNPALQHDVYKQIIQKFPADYFNQLELPIAVRILCIELISQRQFDLLQMLITELPTPNFKETDNEDTYCAFLVRELLRGNVEASKVRDFCNLLVSSGKNKRAYHLAAENALRYDVQMAPELFKLLAQTEQLRAHYFWPLILQNFRQHGETGLEQTLKLMQQHDVQSDHMTLVRYILPRLSLLQTNVKAAVKFLEQNGIKPSLSISPIIATVLPQCKMTEVINLLEEYPQPIGLKQFIPQLATLSISVRVTRQHHQFAKLLTAMWQVTNDPKFDFVGELLQKMLTVHERLQSDPKAFLIYLKTLQKHNLCLSLEAAKSIKMQLQRQKSSSMQEIEQILFQMVDRDRVGQRASSSEEQKPEIETLSDSNQLTVEQLEAQIENLQAHGKNYRGLLRRCLQLCVRDGKVERALEFKQQCDELNVKETPGMCASIFEMYIKLQDMKNAEKTLQHMKSAYPGFQLDEHKLIDYAALLVQNNRLEEAKQILTERSKTQRIIGGDYVVKNVWQLLKNVAENAVQNSAKNVTRQTFELLKELGYCKVENALLGPIIRESLLRYDLRHAIEQFQEIAEQYKYTPLQRELLTLLVRLSNGNLEDCKLYNMEPTEAQQIFNNVCKCIANVHGHVNMHSGMLLAFAEEGTEKQLRRLLLNPEFSLNNEQLVKNFEFLMKSANISPLLRLAKAVRGLTHLFEEQHIYDMILEKYISENNYKAALQLYEHLEADSELKLPEKFIQNLVSFLQANNVVVPANILLKAQISS